MNPRAVNKMDVLIPISLATPKALLHRSSCNPPFGGIFSILAYLVVIEIEGQNTETSNFCNYLSLEQWLFHEQLGPRIDAV